MATCMVVGFKKDLYRASEVLNELIDRGYEWTIDLDDAVAAYRDYNGKLRIDTNFKVNADDGAAPGGLLGSLVGLTLGAIASPMTASANANLTRGAHCGDVYKAAGDALNSRWWKDVFDLSDHFVREVGALVQPGDSAIYALLRTADPTMVEGRFRDYGGVVMSITLNPEQERKLQTAMSSKNFINVAGISPQTKKEKL